MKISLNFLVRIAGMLTLAYVGSLVGRSLSNNPQSETEALATQLLTLAGAGLGLLTTHQWTLVPIERGLKYIRDSSIQELVAVVAGLLLGLISGLLLAVPLGYLPRPLGQFLPMIAAVLLAYLGAVIFSARRKDLAVMLRSPRPAVVLPPPTITSTPQRRRFLLDTSVIIDGRISAVSQTGFLDGTLLIPRFVLNELQMLADSADDQRRTKGRRGLEMLNQMQKEAVPPVEVLDVVVPGANQVDDKLVMLAREYQCPVVTNDYNLGRVAELQGVQVLNLNQLADAIRPPVAHGQDMQVTIRDVGREREQGISFLDDGTMVVVEDARRLIGQSVTVTVTRVFQTQTGRIVFAHLNGERGRA